jgi:hypothetical protein
MAHGEPSDENLGDDGVANGDLRAQISRLEARIDSLAEILERCRKIALVSKAAIPAGALAIGVMIVGPIRFDPMAMIAAMTAVIGGIVVYGSNRATAEQTAASMRDAEALRAELIGGLELRVVDDSLAPQRS